MINLYVSFFEALCHGQLGQLSYNNSNVRKEIRNGNWYSRNKKFYGEIWDPRT